MATSVDGELVPHAQDLGVGRVCAERDHGPYRVYMMRVDCEGARLCREVNIGIQECEHLVSRAMIARPNRRVSGRLSSDGVLVDSVAVPSGHGRSACRVEGEL